MKKDLMVFLVVLVLAMILVVIQGRRAEPAAYALIKKDGEVTMKLLLNIDHHELIKTDLGSNLIRVTDGYVYVQEADCPDQRCVKQGKVDHSGAVIACIPHGLLILLEGRQGGIDAVSQ